MQVIVAMMNALPSDEYGLSGVYVALAHLAGPNQDIAVCIENSNTDNHEMREMGFVRRFLILHERTLRIAHGAAEAASALERIKGLEKDDRASRGPERRYFPHNEKIPPGHLQTPPHRAVFQPGKAEY